MGDLLTNSSIKIKLYCVVLLPILGILYLSFGNIHSKYIVEIEAEKIEKINILNRKIALFVDYLQKERGFGSSYLLSNGEVIVLEQSDNVKNTHKTYEKLLEYAQSLQGDTFQDFVEYLQIFHEELRDVRKDMFKFKLSSDELIAFYSMNIKRLLDFIYNSEDDIENRELSKILFSYANFLSAKEKTGIERAFITNIIIKKNINNRDIFNFNNLMLLRKINIKQFLKFSNDDEIFEKFNAMMRTKHSIEIKIIEKKFSKGDYSFNLSPKEWFSLISLQIEDQNRISEIISQKLLNQSSDFKNQMVQEALYLIYVTFFILLFFLIVIYFIFKEIHKGITDITSAVSFISKNGISQYQKIEIRSNDELGIIADKFNHMVEELLSRDIKNKKITIDLQKSKIELEKSDKIKSQFLANMSHEIRTPLNAILGFSSLLKNKEQDSKKLHYLNIIHKSSENLLEIINDIFDFSKIENNEIILENKEFALVDELCMIRDVFTLKLESKKLNLIMELDENLPIHILIDGMKIKQILINLLENAIKFTKDNKNITFIVKYLEDQKKLYFCIKDEGIGVKKEKQKLIFRPFSQADSSITRKYDGAGLGLSISEKFVEKFGGRLEMQSRYGIGSEFYFTIPIVPIQKNTPQKKVTEYDEIILRGKLLVVEDNKANQAFMKILLDKLHVEFEIVSDGLEAVKSFQNNHYDVILMDENMPNMSGIKATQAIIAIEKEKNLTHTPIIALTANALQGDKENFLAAGMDEYLSKPVSKKSLTDVLNQFLPKQGKREKNNSYNNIIKDLAE